MAARPAILCPVDFSDASVGALRHAAAIAAAADASLIVLTIEDPLLTEAVDLGLGIVWRPEDVERELADFVSRTFDGPALPADRCVYEVALGKPAPEILRVARERNCALIVMSTRGLTGARKLFFGSTTERVLRETTIPVLLTAPTDPGRIDVAAAKRRLRRMLVPVDLSSASAAQIGAAERLAAALDLPVIVAHVVEPLKTRLASRLHHVGLQADRHTQAEDRLRELVAAAPADLEPEVLVAYGDPAEELAKIAKDRQAGLIVIGLHGSPLLGPRMGSVTYRLLCLTPAMVLALPPSVAEREAVAAVAHDRASS